MDTDKILQAYVGPSEISRVKFWRPVPKGRKMAVKKWVFSSNGSNEVAFVTGQIDIKFTQKRHLVRSTEPY